jgi:tetratricopeptide (TPR) repeat protein
MARALEALGRNSEAIDELRTTIAMHPTASEPSSNLIELYSKQKDRKSAIAELRRFLEVTAAAYADQQIFFQANWGYFDQLIRLLMEDHQLDAAGQEYQVMLRYRPNESALHNDYGIVLLQQHRLDEALGQFNEAARINPQWSTPHHNIGLCLAQKNNLDGAIQEFRTTLELDPNEENTRIFLGSALGRKGDVAGAKEQFQKVIEKDPQDADAHLGVAYALGQMKDEAAAMKELKSALELKPDSPTAENDLAWLYATAEDAKLRDPTQALVLARQAVATSEEPNAAFLDTLAEALLINGQPVEALKYELQAAQLDPDNPEFLTRLPRFQAAVQPQVAAKR